MYMCVYSPEYCPCFNVTGWEQGLCEIFSSHSTTLEGAEDLVATVVLIGGSTGDYIGLHSVM